jgi:predicted PurR-regulated permease PerM
MSDWPPARPEASRAGAVGVAPEPTSAAAPMAAPPTAAPPARDGRAPVEIAVEAAIRIGVIAALLFVCYRIVEPFLPPIAWGVIIAVASWPGYQWLLRRLGGRRTAASVLFCTIALLVLLVPVALLSETLVQGAQWLTHGVEQGDFRIPPPPDLSNVPLVGDAIQAFWRDASTNLAEVLRKFQPQLQMLGSWLLHFAASAGVGLLHFVLAIVIAAVLLANSDGGRRVADAISWRLAGVRGIRFARLAEEVVRSVSRGILGVALIQALLAGLGMLAAGFRPRGCGRWWC